VTSPQPQAGQLGRPGAAQSELLIHFCARPEGRPPTPRVPEDIAQLSSEERLDRILWEQRWLGFPPWGADAGQPAVCFSESPRDHLIELLSRRHWPPWGVVVKRQWIYDVGGGPVWYARSEQFDNRTRAQRPWLVRLDADPARWSDWTHEREWRVPVQPVNPVLPFEAEAVVAVLVGSPDWEPTRIDCEVETGHLISGATGMYSDPGDPYAYPELTTVSALPSAWTSSAHWYWDAEASVLNQTP
jgi:hypothetical protein